MTFKQAANLAVLTCAALLKTTCIIGLVMLTACGKPPRTSSDWWGPAECEIVHGQPESANSVTVALLEPVDPVHAPYPRNTSEQIVFRHLYQTLIRIDCFGEVRPDLAGSWDSKEGGRTWTFELNEDAYFWDGTPLTARDVLNSWRSGSIKKTALCYDVDSTSAEGERILNVHFRHPYKKVPRLLSASEFSVAKPAVDSKWPLGSGPYQIVTSKRESAGMFKRTITAYPYYNSEGSIVQFVEASTYDARDLLESAVDMMVTADPAVIDYAGKQPNLETVALPWDRTYVLVSISRFQELRQGGAPGAISPSLSEELARDAVRSDARGFTSPAWWEELADCSDADRIISETIQTTWETFSSSGSQRILYDAGDPVSRDIAERLIALAIANPNASPATAALIAAVPGLGDDTQGMIAQGLRTAELAQSLREGSDFAYIISIPRRLADPCCGARDLIAQIPWLAELGNAFTKVVVPLVDTRSHVIANSTGVGLSIDWYGNVLIMNGMQPER
ncbi:MAG: ABC transporter substrate-binding protein [Candidatus Latescibacterota bacterium]